MNWPNLVTFSRLFLALPFIALIEAPGWRLVALGLFVVASLTDWVDGYLARRLNQTTELGKLMDPLVDKLLVTGALVALAAQGVVPAWSVTAILFREFLVTGLRALEAAQGVIVPAGWPGKVKAALQMIAIIALLLTMDQRAGLPHQLAMGTYWLAVTLTIVSGVQYGWAARRLFRAPVEAA